MSATPIIWDDVVAIAPKLDTGVATAAQDAILDYVNDLDEGAFDTASSYFLARVYLAAHMGATGKRSAVTAGPVIGESDGVLSRQYANLATMASGSGLQSTTFGQLYASIINSNGGTRCPVVV